MSKPFKMRSGNSPIFKHVGSSPIKDEGEEKITKVKHREHFLGGNPTRTSTIKTDKGKVKITEEYDDVLEEWIQIGTGKGKGARKSDVAHDIEKIRERPENIKEVKAEEQSSENVEDTESGDVTWWSSNLDDWVDKSWTPAQAFKEKKLKELLELYPRNHPVVIQEMKNLKGPPPGFKF